MVAQVAQSLRPALVAGNDEAHGVPRCLLQCDERNAGLQPRRPPLHRLGQLVAVRRFRICRSERRDDAVDIPPLDHGGERTRGAEGRDQRSGDPITGFRDARPSRAGEPIRQLRAWQLIPGHRTQQRCHDSLFQTENAHNITFLMPVPF